MPSRSSTPPTRILEEAKPLGDEALRRVLLSLIELHAISMEMGEERSEGEIIRTALEGARSRLGVDRIAVLLRDGDRVRGTWGTDTGGRLVPETSYEAPISTLSQSKMVTKALQERDYVAVVDDAELRMGSDVVGRGWNAMVSLWYGDESLGWIACDNLLHQRPLEPLQVELLKLFGAALSHALVRGRTQSELESLNEELERRVEERTRQIDEAKTALELANAELSRLSQVDGLTTIANRRFFDQQLEIEWARLGREGGELGVVLIDIDEFKSFNDSQGHLAGDAALVRVAACLQKNVFRPADFVARYGGEEFIVLLPHTEIDGAEAIADRLRRAVSAMHIEHPASESGRFLTISLGVATRRAGKGTPKSLIAAADQALYQAKAEGRNIVVVAEPPIN